MSSETINWIEFFTSQFENEKKITMDKNVKKSRKKAVFCSPIREMCRNTEMYSAVYKHFSYLLRNCHPRDWNDVDVTYSLKKSIDDDAYQCVINVLPWIRLKSYHRMYGINNENRHYLLGKTYRDFLENLRNQKDIEFVKNENVPAALMNRSPICVCIVDEKVYYVDTMSSGYAKNVCELIDSVEFSVPLEFSVRALMPFQTPVPVQTPTPVSPVPPVLPVSPVPPVSPAPLVQPVPLVSPVPPVSPVPHVPPVPPPVQTTPIKVASNAVFDSPVRLEECTSKRFRFTMDDFKEPVEETNDCHRRKEYMDAMENYRNAMKEFNRAKQVLDDSIQKLDSVLKYFV